MQQLATLAFFIAAAAPRSVCFSSLLFRALIFAWGKFSFLPSTPQSVRAESLVTEWRQNFRHKTSLKLADMTGHFLAPRLRRRHIKSFLAWKKWPNQVERAARRKRFWQEEGRKGKELVVVFELGFPVVEVAANRENNTPFHFNNLDPVITRFNRIRTSFYYFGHLTRCRRRPALTRRVRIHPDIFWVPFYKMKNRSPIGNRGYNFIKMLLLLRRDKPRFPCTDEWIDGKEELLPNDTIDEKMKTSLGRDQMRELLAALGQRTLRMAARLKARLHDGISHGTGPTNFMKWFTS
jgi:hypothetical protein